MKYKKHYKFFPTWIKFLLFFVKPRYSYDFARKESKDLSIKVTAKFLFGKMYIIKEEHF